MEPKDYNLPYWMLSVEEHWAAMSQDRLFLIEVLGERGGSQRKLTPY
jgi:hypothetical protein